MEPFAWHPGEDMHQVSARAAQTPPGRHAWTLSDVEIRLDLSHAKHATTTIAAARALVCHHLPATLPDACRDDVVRVADSLLAGALQGRAEPRALRVASIQGGQCVRIEVEVQPSRVEGSTHPGPEGIGRDVAFRISERFGVDQHDDCAVLWAEVAAHETCERREPAR